MMSQMEAVSWWNTHEMTLDSELISLKDRGEFQPVHYSKSRLKKIHNNTYDCEWKWNNGTNDAEGRIKNGGIIFRVYPGYSEESYWGAPFQPLFPFSQQNYMSRYHFYQAVRRELPLAWGNNEHKRSFNMHEDSNEHCMWICRFQWSSMYRPSCLIYYTIRLGTWMKIKNNVFLAAWF